ncbi:MAG TPA: NAD(P)/FAD-dependent oxidoreductase [Oligoflexus sp.]|uniref:NAD(P)/FAD-dependent oxidoreductase n=1 Tax=Oligoflexus sp. TaxID=1971216 RepID=UPI002D729931|nr:NAD(P)/FAD-dependent oxidoreductase [Oligoflexus sp.]HYX35587.1 NAD(P)/FAD-dependent oxidoreductase [Oligoflexus sp.]
MTSNYEVLVIGAGPAGLSAAMSLGRMGRHVLLCDDERPRNAASEHLNNFPTQDGINPREWRKRAREDLGKYKTVHFYQGSVLGIEKNGQHFRARFAVREPLNFRKIILAYGIVDHFPPISGMSELWGKSVFHCPYCHGFEVKNTRLGLIGNGQFAEHMLPMLYSLSADMILFTNESQDLDAEFIKKLEAKNVRLVDGKIKELVHENYRLKFLVLENGDTFERDGLFLAPMLPLQSKSELGQLLGCEKNDMGFYKIGMMGNTTVEGVFAAGDITTRMHSVLSSAATGQLAGAGAVAELVAEDFASDLDRGVGPPDGGKVR